MDNSQRATVAFLCGCIHEPHSVSFAGVHDCAQNTFISCDFTNNAGLISVFDYSRSCYLSGRYPTYYDYGVSQYIMLTKVGNNMYNVYDYQTGSYLSITCMGNSINVYDYANSQYYYYLLN